VVPDAAAEVNVRLPLLIVTRASGRTTALCDTGLLWQAATSIIARHAMAAPPQRNGRIVPQRDGRIVRQPAGCIVRQRCCPMLARRSRVAGSFRIIVARIRLDVPIHIFSANAPTLALTHYVWFDRGAPHTPATARTHAMRGRDDVSHRIFDNAKGAFWHRNSFPVQGCITHCRT
jgi:hypothetical protein